MHKQWDLRSAFVFFFPIVIGLIFYSVFSESLQRLDLARQQGTEDEWLNRASILAARVRSEYTTELQAERSFKAIAEHLEKAVTSSDHELPTILTQTFTRQLSPQIAEKCQTWAFVKTRDQFELIEGDRLMNQKKRAFTRVFEALCHLARDSGDSADNRLHERFISGMFGENSSPQHLATERQGRLTPVVYESGHYYLCWRVLELGQNRFLGFISLLPGAFVEDTQAALQRLADQIHQTDANAGLTVFVNSPLLEPVINPVMPRLAAKKTEQANLMQTLRQHWGSEIIRPRQINRIDGRWLYYDFIDTETPYSIAIISDPARVYAYSQRSLQVALLLLLCWILYFFRHRSRGTLSLSTAFRLLFFMTGMLPVAVLVLLVVNLIDESVEARIKSRINHARETLRKTDQNSENISHWCSMILGDLLKKPQLQRQLNRPDMQKQGFEFLTHELHRRNYSLQYLLLFKPGHEPRCLTVLPGHAAMARFHLDYFAVSCESLSRMFAIYHPSMPVIKLSAMQKTLLGIFDNLGTSVAKQIFLDSIERMTYMKTGNNARNFFYNSIIIDDQGLPLYLVISVSTLSTFEHMLDNELRNRNIKGQTTFACFNRNLASAQKIMPTISGQFMESQAGKTMRSFVDSAASSRVGLILRETDNIFIYEPMLKLGAWYGGAAIDVSDLVRETGWRQFLLLCSVFALALVIYVLSATAARIFIAPTGLLSGVFAAIATGDYKQRFDYKYENELGELATATNNMVSGLKERQMLGKFVSTTFDSQVSSLTAEAHAQKLTGVILFSDVRSFTTLSEANTPVAISQMLNQHLRSMVEAINSNGGRVDQFIGDAVVAFFPGEGASSCTKAVKAAVAMMQQHRRLNNERQQRGMFTYNIGIGLAYGTVIAGALNSGNRSEFTIIGRARSTAEQLEAQSKTSRHTAIIISDSLFAMLPDWQQHFCPHENESHEILDLEAFT